MPGKKKSSSSSTPRRSNAPPRDPSDDQAVALISKQTREKEWDQVRHGQGQGMSKREQQEKYAEQERRYEERPRSSHGLLNKNGRNRNNNEEETRRRATLHLESQLLEQARGTNSSKKYNNRTGDKSPSLGKFIGRQNLKDRDVLPPIEAHCATSVACSALTTPSALLDGSTVSNVSEERYDDDEAHEPLLGSKSKHHSNKHSSGSIASGSTYTSNGGKKEKRVNFSNKYYSSKSSNGKHSSKSSSTNSSGSYESSTSALSMRKSGKRPWFASTYGKSNNQSGSGYESSRGPYSSSTGVQYRSATSTQRALEELKRKRIEMQEKRRAVTILVVLMMIAGGVHFAGRDGYNFLFFGSQSTVGGGETGLRGSRDKVYGDTKDLGYGGERVGLVQTALKMASAELKQSDQGNSAAATGGADGEEDYEYKIPPPVEKTYDPEHEFLLPLRHFADVTDPIRSSDTAFFFHVPRAGGSTMKDIVGKCLKLVQSSEVGVRDGHGTDPKLQVLDVHESQYVNVDTTTIPGIQRAVDLGLSSSGLANVIVSSYLHESAALFDLTHQGRAFILLRDPIERATSMYWHRVKEVGDLEASVTIEEYAQGNGIENNWMCRFLANRMTGELTKDDLEQAKVILKDKFLVGFVDDLEESVHRIMKYNGWKFSSDETDKMQEEDCIKDLSDASGGSNVNSYEYEIPKRGSQAHALISWQTQFDSKLFAYAKEIFDHQTKEWGTKERKKLLKKEKKKKGG